MYYVYSLKCRDGYYIGCTDNLKDRLERHRKRQVRATAGRLPIKLNFYFVIKDKHKAFEFEKYLKSGSGRAFKLQSNLLRCVQTMAKIAKTLKRGNGILVLAIIYGNALKSIILTRQSFKNL